MGVIVFISCLIVFSVIVVSFVIAPAYSLEDKCNIEKDLRSYDEFLKDDTVIQAFLQKYPSAVSTPSGMIDDSSQTSIHYKYEDDITKVHLTVQIIESRPTSNDCFIPFAYAINYQDHKKHLLIQGYDGQTREILDFLHGIKNQSPIMLLLHSNYSAFPIVIDKFQYYIPYKISGSSISGIFPNCTIDSVMILLDSSSDGKLTIAMPRNVLDAKSGYADSEYIILLDDEEANFKEIYTDSAFRILEIQLYANSRNLEIIASSTFATSAANNCGIKENPNYRVLLTPIQQLMAGIKPNDVDCKEGQVLIFRPNPTHMACVKQETKTKLVERGWTTLSGNSMQELPVQDHFSTGHKLDHVGYNDVRTSLAEYFTQDSSLMLFYQYCNCTKSQGSTDEETSRANSQVLNVDGVSVVAYPNTVLDYTNQVYDKYVFVFYYDGYRISLHTDQKLEPGLALVKELLDYENGIKQQNVKNSIPHIRIVLGAANPEQQENYVPKNILVVIGINNTVTWINEDDVPNGVASDTSLFDSGPINPKNTWTYTFEKSGTFGYHGQPHPWQKGTIIVKEK